MKSHIAIAIHGGAGDDSEFIHLHYEEYKEGLTQAAKAGYSTLLKGGDAVESVEEAVKQLEDNPLFNAGRGSALNCRGEIEMDASIMYGKGLKAGAVSMVRNVRNPISLARLVLEETRHVYVSGEGAQDLAFSKNLPQEPSAYFITGHQLETYKQEHEEENLEDMLEKRITGTVGAVAMDKHGNLASATSTGGSVNSLPGRIGDSCIIGAGCYADNRFAALSGTGDGEYLITGVITYSIIKTMELLGCTLQEACDRVIHKDNRHTKGDLGVIGISKNGEIAMAFNTKRMHRATIDIYGNLTVNIYKD
jgi:beta-aspartyl-peptidase (threonine type)